MNRCRKLYSHVKAINHLFESGQSYKIPRDIISIRSLSNAANTCESSQINGDHSNIPSELSSTKPQKNRSVIQPAEVQDFSDYGSTLKPTFNFAAYADKSPLLQKLLELGVELYKWENSPSSVEFILRLDYDKAIKPYLIFLIKHKVPFDKLGWFLTKNPFILKEDFDDLEVRINYLRSKDFTEDMIGNNITRNPRWLSIPVKEIDTKLGYLQQTFKLQGKEVRSLVVKEPTLVNLPMKVLYLTCMVLKEEMELDEEMVKRLVINQPHLLRQAPREFLSTYDYLRRVMKIPTNLIIKCAAILNYKKYKLNERHTFLVSLGRAQYNPMLPQYVPLSSFCSKTDEQFCQEDARASLETFYEFLKTL